MPQKKKSDSSYEMFTASVSSGQIGSLYIFHGDERYLLEHSLAELRRHLCPDGLKSFNYRKFEGRDIRLSELDDAISTLPVFASRTLVEVHDFDIFKGIKKTASEKISAETPLPAKSTKNDEHSDKQRLAEIFSDLPEYVCVVIVYNAIQYKPDGRLKLDKEILKHAQVVEFTVQEQSKLNKWISTHFEAAGKRISKLDAEYLTLITDGYMTAIASEIEKLSAYSNGETVTRKDIDAVVTPVLNAFAYKLTDAILERKHAVAMRILDELFQMREPPQKIIFSISLKMRQSLAARVCIDENLGKSALMDMCGIRFDFQASALMATASKATLARCRNSVLLCAEAALDLNRATDPKARLIELVAQLALVSA